MEWFDLVSTYEPTNNPLSTYDQLRLWFDHMRTYVIFIYLILLYYTGFAPKGRMPILKTLLLIVVLFMGAMLFSVLDIMNLPVRSALFVALIIMALARLRRKDLREEA
ncbi:YlaH-like family protein [Brevibacillus ginsengisoli]|uniref:YlaH-like family protein n=1 Tax=Brevibacillus ginsengisoli TaxID=363854 RepID=UPI003CF4F2CF